MVERMRKTRLRWCRPWGIPAFLCGSALAIVLTPGCVPEPTTEAATDSGASRAPAVIPGDTAPPPPERTLTAPGLLAITCGAVIPTEGKIPCEGSFTWPEGDPEWSGAIAVGIHGRSSAAFPKKQYAIELRDSEGADAPVGLFGMGADADWVLNGMYLDRSLLRNRLAFDLFRAFGDWAPASDYVELTLDGSYLGLYSLCERIEPGKHRLDLPKDDGSGSSFIVRADESGYPSAVQYAAWGLVYPEGADEAVNARIAAWEVLVSAGDPSLWEEMDEAGFIDFVLLEEALRNNDGYFLSHHLYRDGRSEKLGLVPWDLDLTLGVPDYNDNQLSEGWVAYRPALIANPALTPEFTARLSARWSELRAGELGTSVLLARIDGYRAEMGEAVGRNWAVWDISQVGPLSGFPTYTVTSPDEEYARIAAFLEARLAWMDAAIDSY